MTINEQILAIIEKRQQRLPIVDNRMAHWRDLRKALSDLETALAPTGRRSEKTIGAIDALSRIRESGIHAQIRAREQDWDRVRNRFGRNTVNIGVSGQEKVGKSTLLQTISGLSNDEVPASIDRCTAVRSRIYHDPSSKAVVTIRTWESFREKILAPLYQVLWQKPPPLTLDQFEHDGLRDPIIRSSPGFDEKDADIKSALKDLKDDQKAVWSYRDLLKGEQRTITLKNIKDIKEYVAYSQCSRQDLHRPDRGCARPNCGLRPTPTAFGASGRETWCHGFESLATHP